MTERDVLDVVEAVRKIVATYRLPAGGATEQPARASLTA
jgi:hypothetical protein